MAPPQAPSGHGQQEVKNPPESSIEVEPSPILNGSPQIVGRKRQRSDSRSESHPKRPLPPKKQDNSNYPKLPRPEDDWRCPGCGLLCWRCHSASKVIHNPSKAGEEGASESASMEPPSIPESAASLPPSHPSTYQSPSSIHPPPVSQSSKNKRKKCEERGLRYIGPKEADFLGFILKPCGLRQERYTPSSLTPAHIFGSQSDTPPSRVFIQKNETELQEIIHEFLEYQIRGYDEYTLMTICHDSIVLRDRFIPEPLLYDDSATIRSVRRDKWKPGKAGPPIPGGAYTYDWDLEPDTTFAVSINIFDVELRRMLELKSRWLAEAGSVCPYLTIEYKCPDKSGKFRDATSQIATASILWLYQRKKIRDALSIGVDDLRHYSITICDDNYKVYEARFESGLYAVRTLVHGLLTHMDGLKTYIEWSNAIHAWGLGPHATSSKDDIKKLLERER